MRYQDAKAAIARRNERRARKRKRKAVFGVYPRKGFAEARKQLASPSNVCSECGITSAEHIKAYAVDLALDHIIPARWLAIMDQNPHEVFNFHWLCSQGKNCHGRGKKEAEAQLMGKGGLYAFVTVLRTSSVPYLAAVRAAMDSYGFRTDLLPW